MSKFFKNRAAAKEKAPDKAVVMKRNLEQEIEKELAVMSISMPFLPKCQVRGLVLNKLGLQPGKTEKTLMRKGGGRILKAVHSIIVTANVSYHVNRIDFNKISLDFPASPNNEMPTSMEHPRNIRKKILGRSKAFTIEGQPAPIRIEKAAAADDSYGFSQATPLEQAPRPYERKTKTTRPPNQKPKKTLRRRLYSIFNDEPEQADTTFVEHRPAEEPKRTFYTSTPKKRTSVRPQEEDRASWTEEAAHVQTADGDSPNDASVRSHSSQGNSYIEMPEWTEVAAHVQLVDHDSLNDASERSVDAQENSDTEMSEWTEGAAHVQPVDHDSPNDASERSVDAQENSDTEMSEWTEEAAHVQPVDRDSLDDASDRSHYAQENSDTEVSEIGKNMLESSEDESENESYQPIPQARKDALDIPESTDENINSPMQAEDDEHASPVFNAKPGGYARLRRSRLCRATDKRTERYVPVLAEATPVAVLVPEKESQKKSSPDKQSEENLTLSGVPRSSSPVPGSVAMPDEDQSFEILDTFESPQEPLIDTAVMPETPSDAASTIVTPPEKRNAHDSLTDKSQRSFLSSHSDTFEYPQEPLINAAAVPETPSDVASTTVTPPEKRNTHDSLNDKSQRSSLSRRSTPLQVTGRPREPFERLRGSPFYSASQTLMSNGYSAGSRRDSPAEISPNTDFLSRRRTRQENNEVRPGSGNTSVGSSASGGRRCGADESALAATPGGLSSSLSGCSSTTLLSASQEPPFVVVPRSAWERRSPTKYISSEGATSGDSLGDLDQNEAGVSHHSSGVRDTPTTAGRSYRGLSTKKGVPWINQVPNQRMTARRTLLLTSSSEYSHTEKNPEAQKSMFGSYEQTETCDEATQLGTGVETPTSHDHCSVGRLVLRAGADRLETSEKSHTEKTPKSQKSRFASYEQTEICDEAAQLGTGVETPTSHDHCSVGRLVLRAGADRLETSEKSHTEKTPKPQKSRFASYEQTEICDEANQLRTGVKTPTLHDHWSVASLVFRAGSVRLETSEKTDSEKNPGESQKYMFASYEQMQICDEATPTSQIRTREETPPSRDLSVDRLLLRSGADRLDGLPFPSGEAVRPYTKAWLHQRKLDSSDSSNLLTPTPARLQKKDSGSADRAPTIIHQKPPSSIDDWSTCAASVYTKSIKEIILQSQSTASSQSNYEDMLDSTYTNLQATVPLEQSSVSQEQSSPAKWWQENDVMSALVELGGVEEALSKIDVPEPQSSPSIVSALSEDSDYQDVPMNFQ